MLHLAIVKDELPCVSGDHLDIILSQVTRIKPEPWVSHFSSIILVRWINIGFNSDDEDREIKEVLVQLRMGRD